MTTHLIENQEAAGYSGENIIQSRNKETDNRLMGGGYSPTNITTTRTNATDTIPDKDNQNQDPKKDKKKNAT